MPARQDSKVTRKQVGERLRRARIREALSQKELADKIAVSQATVSLWESGRHPVQAEDQTRLTNILGDFIHEAAVDAREAEAKGGSAFGAWLSKTRTEKGMSVPELASKSGITAPAIYNIESGKSLNPQRRLVVG